jgi:AraC-like DNA-binding protein
VQVVAGVAEVCAALREWHDACLVIVVPATANAIWWTEFRRVRQLFPVVPVLAVAVLGHSSFEAVHQLGLANVCELVTMTQRVDQDDLRIALARAHADGVVARVWDRARLQIPKELVTIFRRALRLAHTDFSAEDLAHVAQMHERSLRKYCERHRLPSPQRLVGWTRLLLAAYYLDQRGYSLQAVADLLAFPTPDALRKLLVRYTGLTSAALRAEGALHTIARRFETAAVPSTVFE